MDGYMGEVKMFAGNYAPENWAFCEGQLLTISSYSALYSIVGTQFGGDGRTTFGLPDLRGRAPIGAGQGIGLTNRIPAQMSGFEKVPLNSGALPPHNHTVNCDTTSDSRSISVNPEGNVPAIASGATYGGNLAGGHHMNANMINTTGNGDPHENMQPWIAMRYIICLIGQWPPRS